jgi:hypothetical protein
MKLGHVAPPTRTASPARVFLRADDGNKSVSVQFFRADLKIGVSPFSPGGRENWCQIFFSGRAVDSSRFSVFRKTK